MSTSQITFSTAYVDNFYKGLLDLVPQMKCRFENVQRFKKYLELQKSEQNKTILSLSGDCCSFRSTPCGQEMNPPKNWSLSARDKFPIAVGIFKKGRLVISKFLSHLTVKGRYGIKQLQNHHRDVLKSYCRFIHLTSQ